MIIKLIAIVIFFSIIATGADVKEKAFNINAIFDRSEIAFSLQSEVQKRIHIILANFAKKDFDFGAEGKEYEPLFKDLDLKFKALWISEMLKEFSKEELMYFEKLVQHKSSQKFIAINLRLHKSEEFKKIVLDEFNKLKMVKKSVSEPVKK